MSRSLAPLATAALAAASLAGCVIFTDDDATLIVHNHSSYVIIDVRLAEVGDPVRGPNLLPDVLYPGEDLIIDDIACGHYDVMVVDEYEVDCVLADLDLCFRNESWAITNTTLAACAFDR